jgi:hypothetical protein
VTGCFQITATERTEVLIDPFPGEQAICCPNSLLQQQSHEEFAAGWRPDFPHLLLEEGLGTSFELQ